MTFTRLRAALPLPLRAPLPQCRPAINFSITATPSRTRLAKASAASSARSYAEWRGRKGCLRCGDETHYVKDCTAPQLCFRCGKPGHKTKKCPEPKRCDLCGSVDHLSSKCKASDATRADHKAAWLSRKKKIAGPALVYETKKAPTTMVARRVGSDGTGPRGT